MNSRQRFSRCRRCAAWPAPAAVLAAAAGLVLGASVGSAGCSSPGGDALVASGAGARDAGAAPASPASGTATPGAPPRRSDAAPARGPGPVSRYYGAYLDEKLDGAFARAQAGYRSVIDDGTADPDLAARAALRLAEYQANAGRRHVALDLVARAAALGHDQPALLRWAERLQKRLAAVRVHDIEVRGPPAGTQLEGVSPAARDLFARAEELLAAYHGRRLKPHLEELRADVRAKRRALEAAVHVYRQVVALGEPVAVVAAEFRIASLYYDLSISADLRSAARARARRGGPGAAVAPVAGAVRPRPGQGRLPARPRRRRGWPGRARRQGLARCRRAGPALGRGSPGRARLRRPRRPRASSPG